MEHETQISVKKFQVFPPQAGSRRGGTSFKFQVNYGGKRKI